MSSFGNKLVCFNPNSKHQNQIPITSSNESKKKFVPYKRVKRTFFKGFSNNATAKRKFDEKKPLKGAKRLKTSTCDLNWIPQELKTVIDLLDNK